MWWAGGLVAITGVGLTGFLLYRRSKKNALGDGEEEEALSVYGKVIDI